MIHKPAEKDQRGRKAQAMVEFALAVPIVMVLVLAVFDFGRLLFVYTSLAAATREAARYGAGVGSNGSVDLYNDCAGIKAAAIRIGRFSGLQADQITIWHDTGPTDLTPEQYCTSSKPTAVFQPDDRISVKASVPFTPVTPLVNIPALLLKSENSHTVLMGAEVLAEQKTIQTGAKLCDVSAYSITNQSNPLGPDDTITISNTSGTATSIVDVTVVWDTTSSPVLVSIDPPSGSSISINSSGPYADLPVTWSFPTGNSTLTLHFSRVLKNNVIVRFTLAGEDQCAFGK